MMKEKRPAPVQGRSRGGEAVHIQLADNSTAPATEQPRIAPFRQIGTVAETVVKDALLHEFRQARRHAQLVLNEIDFAGVALGYGLVSPEEAMALLSPITLDWLDLEPRTIEQQQRAAA